MMEGKEVEENMVDFNEKIDLRNERIESIYNYNNEELDIKNKGRFRYTIEEIEIYNILKYIMREQEGLYLLSGDRGCGKTSLINRVELNYENEYEYLKINWKILQYDLYYEILNKILEELREEKIFLEEQYLIENNYIQKMVYEKNKDFKNLIFEILKIDIEKNELDSELIRKKEYIKEIGNKIEANEKIINKIERIKGEFIFTSKHIIINDEEYLNSNFEKEIFLENKKFIANLGLNLKSSLDLSLLKEFNLKKEEGKVEKKSIEENIRKELIKNEDKFNLYREINEIIDEYLGSKKLVIFIDELDKYNVKLIENILDKYKELFVKKNLVIIITTDKLNGLTIEKKYNDYFTDIIFYNNPTAENCIVKLKNMGFSGDINDYLNIYFNTEGNNRELMKLKIKKNETYKKYNYNYEGLLLYLIQQDDFYKSIPNKYQDIITSYIKNIIMNYCIIGELDIIKLNEYKEEFLRNRGCNFIIISQILDKINNVILEKKYFKSENDLKNNYYKVCEDIESKVKIKNEKLEMYYNNKEINYIESYNFDSIYKAIVYIENHRMEMIGMILFYPNIENEKFDHNYKPLFNGAIILWNGFEYSAVLFIGYPGLTSHKKSEWKSLREFLSKNKINYIEIKDDSFNYYINRDIEEYSAVNNMEIKKIISNGAKKFMDSWITKLKENKYNY